jgi:heavy metal efflux system protein
MFKIILVNFKYSLFLLLGLSFVCIFAEAQKAVNINDAVQIALINHPLAKNAELNVQSAESSAGAYPYLKPTEFNFIYGQTHSATYTKSFEISQNLGSPFTQYQNIKLGKEQVQLSKADQVLTLKQLASMVKTAYMKWLFDRLMIRQTLSEAELCGDFENYYPANAPDSQILQKASAQSLYADVQRRQYNAEEEFHFSTNQMQQLLCINETPVLSDTTMELYAIAAFRPGNDKFQPWAYINYYEQQQKVLDRKVSLEQSKLTPEIKGGYFTQQIEQLAGFKGYMVGITLPLFFNTQVSKIKEAKFNREIAKNESEFQKLGLRSTIENLQIRLNQYFVNISYFRENALPESDIIIRTAIKLLTDKKISYQVYLENITKSFKIKSEYLAELRRYNETAIELEHYLN